ncbi:MAG: cytochrome c oxidase subunit 3, partial [Candidatus Limnocylindria bacterium]
WGTGLVILFFSIAFASFLLAYFYLRLENEQWPPPGIPMPRFGVALVATAAVVASAGAMYGALRAIRRGSSGGLRTGLAVSILAGAAAVGLQASELVGLTFDSHTHAYGSIFHAVGWFVVTLAAGGVGMAALTLYWTTRHHYTTRRHVPVVNAAQFWAAAVIMWLVGLGTLYVVPYLT